MDPGLYRAAMEGDVVVLLQYRDQLEVQLTPKENTVLHIAALFGKTQIVKGILRFCPSLSRRLNSQGETPLHIAARGGHSDITKELVDFAGPKTDEEQQENGRRYGGGMPGILRMKNANGDTAVHEAVRNVHLDVVKLLLEEDRQFTYPAIKAEETPLYAAAVKGLDEFVAEILRTCTSPTYGGPGGRTALHAAVISGSRAAQSHINPTLQLAKILTRSGARVTFATTATGLGRLKSLPTIDNLSYATFFDCDEQNINDYLVTLRRMGPQTLTKLLQDLSNSDLPVTFIIYTVLLPWVAEVARDFHVPSAFLFIQCATVFAIFHRFFNSQDGLHDNIVHDINNPDFSLKLPGLPLFTSRDIPTFLLPGNEFHASMVPTFHEQIQTLEKDPNPCVLVNTFDALEEDIIGSFPSMKFIAVGPLVPSAFSDGSNSHDKSFGGDLFESSRDYLSWLDSKPDKSVIYVSFGSLLVLKETQKEEILHGLMESGRPFLWIIRDINEEELKSMRGKNEISEELGLIVPWCSQVEVLCHRAIGCFLTHCGWNSTVESIIGGVPVVGCPHFSEQNTNIKIMEEVWGNGVRVKENEEGVFGRDEIRRCLDVVMGEGEKGKEVRRTALKWKSLAVEAVKEGGSSNKNLQLLLEMY